MIRSPIGYLLDVVWLQLHVRVPECFEASYCIQYLFSFVKNHSCVTQICITKIAVKCILVVVVKWYHHASVLSSFCWEGGREKALGTMLSYWEWRPGCIIGGLYGTRFIQYQSLALFLHSDRPYSLVSLQCYVKRLFQWQVRCVYDGLFQPRKTASAAMQSWLPLEVCWPMAQGRWYSASNINCANHVDSVLVYCIICIDSTVYHYEKSDWSTWEVASPRCDIFIFQNHYC